MGVVKEITGKKRNRIFVYDRYLQLLTESIERDSPIAEFLARKSLYILRY